MSGCSGAEISGFIGINPVTLYARCLSDNGILYSEYSREFLSKGESILRAHQYSKALGTTHKGDNTLLIWLGKTRLKQQETTNVNTSLTIETVDFSNAKDPYEESKG